jgi:hypothetical protein
MVKEMLACIGQFRGKRRLTPVLTAATRLFPDRY